MKILGVDQSLTSTGICVMYEEFLVVEHFGLIRTDKTYGDDFERVHIISHEILQFCNSFEIDLLRLEGLSYGSKGDATRKLGGLQFCIVNYVRNYNYNLHKEVEIEIIPPTSLKRFATGKGTANKEEMFDALPDEQKNEFLRFPKTKGRYDLTDAFWLCLYKEGGSMK